MTPCLRPMRIHRRVPSIHSYVLHSSRTRRLSRCTRRSTTRIYSGTEAEGRLCPISINISTNIIGSKSEERTERDSPSIVGIGGVITTEHNNTVIDKGVSQGEGCHSYDEFHDSVPGLLELSPASRAWTY